MKALFRKIRDALAKALLPPDTFEKRSQLQAIRDEMDFLEPILKQHSKRCRELLAQDKWRELDAEIARYNQAIRRWERVISIPLKNL